MGAQPSPSHCGKWPAAPEMPSIRPRCTHTYPPGAYGCIFQRGDGSWARKNTTDGLVRRENMAEYPRLLSAMRSTNRVASALDAGANEGFSTRLFSLLLPGATIVSLEPSIDNFQMLQLNTAAFAPVRILRAALWPSSANLSVIPGDAGAWGMRMEQHVGGSQTKQKLRGSQPTERMPGVSVSQLLMMACLASFDFIKVSGTGERQRGVIATQLSRHTVCT
uniref:Methyltransferase FkbM domain-containing protein n=1 Tax=Haptolina ericina TaxID=156174 RepID=A0A7S3EY69_9EUKA|mmetsp:Transcript_31970/g.72137  ORF Transcript_31970/g.72137 Transcript_31970/m.72137 type:complete len:221 (+) Transcript_31970:45-707(+)